MKRIIDHKLYDSDRAIQIVDVSLSGYCETLYKTKSGNYFIHGKGDATSPYGKTLSNGQQEAGEDVIPLTLAGAKLWLERNIIEHNEMYLDMLTNNSKRNISITLSDAIICKLDELADELGTKRSTLLERIIIDYICRETKSD